MKRIHIDDWLLYKECFLAVVRNSRYGFTDFPTVAFATYNYLKQVKDTGKLPKRKGEEGDI